MVCQLLKQKAALTVCRGAGDVLPSSFRAMSQFDPPPAALFRPLAGRRSLSFMHRD